jgi:lipooligosaccharide transport system permease protein
MTQIYNGMVSSPILVSEIVGGEMLSEITRSLLYGGVFFIVLLVLGLVHSWWAVLLPIPLALTGLLFGAPALLVAGCARSHEQLFSYYTLVITPLFLFSGVFFPIGRLPHLVQDLIIVLPLYHAVDLGRSLILGQVSLNALTDLGWLLVYTAVMLALPGRVLERRLTA